MTAVRKKTAAALAPLVDKVEFFDIEQKTDEWHELRRGLPTTSKFATIMANGKDGGESKTRQNYMDMLAGEIISGQIAESFRSEAMERGNRMEPEAREWYARTRFVDLEPVGFARRTVYNPLGNTFVIGCSPDSKVSARKGLEIKSRAPHLLVDASRRGAAAFPSEHRAQIQGTMWACDWDEMDLVLYYTGWPSPPVFTIIRDEAYIARLRNEVERFAYELAQLVKRIRDDG